MRAGGDGRDRPFTLASGRFLAEIDFDVSLRGYRRHQVDLYLIEVHHELADQTRRAEAAERCLAEREAELALLRVEAAHREPPDPATTAPANWLGWRLEQLLSSAEEEAEQIRAQAHREREEVHRYAEVVHDRLASMVQVIDRLNEDRPDQEEEPDQKKVIKHPTHPKAA